jgi:hypothetical protein
MEYWSNGLLDAEYLMLQVTGYKFSLSPLGLPLGRHKRQLGQAAKG